MVSSYYPGKRTITNVVSTDPVYPSDSLIPKSSNRPSLAYDYLTPYSVVWPGIYYPGLLATSGVTYIDNPYLFIPKPKQRF